MGAIRSTANRIFRGLGDPWNALPLLLIAAFVARAAWIDLPSGSLIFDETYYVNAARIILGLPVVEGAPYAGSPIGLDPNTEHPALGKVLIALSMQVFGDNGVGWRLPSVIAGMVALGAVYAIVRATGETVRLALLVVAILAFDNLTLVHSRIGTLDMLALAPALAGVALGLRGRWGLAGVLIGIGFLVRVTATFALLAMLIVLAFGLWDLWQRDRRIPWRDVRPGIVMVAAFSIVAIAGLWLLDLRFTTFPTPVDHLAHMVSYGASLQESIDRGGICRTTSSAPWQWPFNECQINYLRVDVTVREGGEVVSTIPSIDFRGALNPLFAAAIPLATLFLVWFAWKTKDRLARWSVAWIVANYVPWLVLAIVNHRVTYIYYFVAVLPGLAAAVAILLLRSGLPRFVAWGYVVAYAVGFAAYFPFRQLP